VTLPFTVAQDYSIGDFSSTSQTVSVGQSITYNLAVLPVGAAYNNAVTLSCIITPLFAGACTFSPNPAGPLSNATSAAVVMTVTTQTTNGRLLRPGAKSNSWLYAVWLALPAVVVWGARSRRRCNPAALVGFALAVLFLLPSCGGGSNGSSGPRAMHRGAHFPEPTQLMLPAHQPASANLVARPLRSSYNDRRGRSGQPFANRDYRK